MITLRQHSKIWKARPNLIDVSPLTFWLCVTFIALNLALSYVIWFVPSQPILVIYKMIPVHIASIVFLLLGVGLIVALYYNIWKMIRVVLAVGLFFKSLYAYSLVALGFQVGFLEISGVMSLWLFAVFVQVITVLFFLPPSIQTQIGEKKGAKR